MFDGDGMATVPLRHRDSIDGTSISGPMLVVEDQTSIAIPADTSVFADETGAVHLTHFARQSS